MKSQKKNLFSLMEIIVTMIIRYIFIITDLVKVLLWYLKVINLYFQE